MMSCGRKLGFLLCGMFFLLNTAYPSGNVAAGKAASATCAACHGPDGNSVTSIWPKLAGQNAKYLLKQLKDFKKGNDGGRFAPAMTPLTQSMSVQDMENLAAFFASQTVKVGATEKALLEKGRRLYRGGDLQTHIAACSACHGPRGLGNRYAGFPALSGQHPDYVVKQLEAYKAGTRTNDYNHIMRDIAKRMTKEQMKAVASYVSGLH